MGHAQPQLPLQVFTAVAAHVVDHAQPKLPLQVFTAEEANLIGHSQPQLPLHLQWGGSRSSCAPPSRACSTAPPPASPSTPAQDARGSRHAAAGAPFEQKRWLGCHATQHGPAPRDPFCCHVYPGTRPCTLASCGPTEGHAHAYMHPLHLAMDSAQFYSPTKYASSETADWAPVLITLITHHGMVHATILRQWLGFQALFCAKPRGQSHCSLLLECDGGA